MMLTQVLTAILTQPFMCHRRESGWETKTKKELTQATAVTFSLSSRRHGAFTNQTEPL